VKVLDIRSGGLYGLHMSPKRENSTAPGFIHYCRPKNWLRLYAIMPREAEQHPEFGGSA
jgi:hypothetical protein